MIKVNRIKSDVDEGIIYKILIDNIENDEIKNGQSKTLKLRSNSYKIQLEGKNIKSNIITFVVDNKRDYNFICYPSYKNNFISKFIHKKILRKGITLKLEK